MFTSLGSSAHARTSTFDPDNLYAPTANDETVLLVYGTYDDIVNATDVTVTEQGSGSNISHDTTQLKLWNIIDHTQLRISGQ